jgi:tripartite ATP-independent transporter DctM subunit
LPPSNILVVYGNATETHIGKLYAAGILPGLLGLFLYCGAITWVVLRDKSTAPTASRIPMNERWSALRQIFFVILLLLVVLGGIYGGFFTASEAAGVGAFGAFLIALARGSLKQGKLMKILIDSAQTSTVLFSILIGATVFSEFLNYTNGTRVLVESITNWDLSPTMVILIIAGVYLLLGMVMEELSMLLLTLPVFFPIVIELGYDPVWFGIFVIVMCEIGLITPPVGINLFVLRTVVPDVSMMTMIRGIVPFIAADIVRVLLLIAFPAIALVLPSALF